MKFRLSRLFKRNILIHRLMLIYGLLLGLIIFLIMLFLTFFVANNTYQQEMNNLENKTQDLSNDTRNKDELTSKILKELALTPIKYESMRNYLLLSPPEYFAYSSDINNQYDTNVHFAKLLTNIFETDSSVKSIDIVLDEAEEYIHADQKAKNGVKKSGAVKQQDLSFFRSLRSPVTGEDTGEVYITYSNEDLKNIVKEDDLQPSYFIFSESGAPLFRSEKNKKPLESDLAKSVVNKQNITQKTLNNKYYIKTERLQESVIIGVLKKSELWTKIGKSILIIVISGSLILLLLLYILNNIFRKYYDQVNLIVSTTDKISEGDLNARIDTERVQLELKDLAEAINQMIESINQYVKDIYILEIEQRDAQMRALQSQINPHFLSNTLEYIRMYALSSGQEELSEIVYAFSTLLKNNINQEKTTTLKKELDFCEKYVYLFQMRYPNSVAYDFQIDEKLNSFIIPKFIIQPLIENYFIHGIDFNQKDNAISVKAFKKEKDVKIIIKDNGKGASDEKLGLLKKELEINTLENAKSIGIKNVYQRLKGYFENCRMDIYSDEQGFCITVMIYGILEA